MPNCITPQPSEIYVIATLKNSAPTASADSYAQTTFIKTSNNTRKTTDKPCHTN
ncbi:hypothetical protein HCG51_12920 [Tolypothrix sp. PCC 7910]|uniref:hypothetical protein n=1 Tax=Tolypothrix sp. PCC 7910 TaxID=2099387 RepID=UPI0014279FDD|nr:hypothetical protein [Tolypothrix sp. PCC 7910]QIR37519.1 hypothetical protein HCG51_12920 [Tolypothrix sp. PCC 7910]